MIKGLLRVGCCSEAKVNWIQTLSLLRDRAYILIRSEDLCLSYYGGVRVFLLGIEDVMSTLRWPPSEVILPYLAT